MSVGTETPAGPGTSEVPGSGHVRVTAVLVVHDGAEWLPRTLAALAGSLRPPDVVVAVDAGSGDRSAVLLDTAVGASPGRVLDAVVTGDARDGFGVSVRRGLAAADALHAERQGEREGEPAAGVRLDAEEWVWLLHDDSAPQPDALDELLSVVVASPTLGVAGCKLVGWDDPTRLSEVGATVTPGGRRLTDLVPGDIDQGQHDARGDVLLVSTAGMLVRRTVLDHVGGFDPALPLVGDDVDLCLRVRRAGHRVAVVPSAVVRHVGALEQGARPADALHGRLARRMGAEAPRAGGPRGGLESARRRHWLHARLVQAPTVLLPLLWLWVLAVAPVRSAVWLLRGHPGRAWAELDAAARLLARGWRVVGSRWRSRGARVVPAATLRPLRRSRSQVLREDLDAWRARRSLRREGTAPDDDDEVPLEALESGPVDEDLIDLHLGAGGPARRLLGHPLTYLVPLVLAVGALPLLRRVVAAAAGTDPGEGDDPAGGAATDSVTGIGTAAGDPTGGLDAVELWSRATSDWRDVGLGQVGAADPATSVWAGLTALTSLLRTGSVDQLSLGAAHSAVLLLAPLLALLTAYAMLRPLVRSRAAAAGAALAWALLPATGLLGATHPGDLVVHAVLPLLPATFAGCLGRRPVRSAAAAALLSALVVALSPGTWPVLVVTAALVGALGGARSLASWRAALPLLAVASPLVVWAAWVPALRRDPRLLLLDPAGVDPTLVPVPTAAGLLDAAAPALALLRGQSTDAGPTAVAVAASLGLLGLAVAVAGALLLAGVSRARVPAAWSAVGVAVVAGVTGVAAVLVARSLGAPPSVPASAAALALLLGVALLVRDLEDPDRPSPRADGGARLVLDRLVRTARVLVPGALVAVAVAVALVVPASAPPGSLPAPALVGAGSPQATRTLLLQPRPAPEPGVPSAGASQPVLGWEVTAGQRGPGQAGVATAPADAERPARAGDRLLADTVASALGDGPVPGADVAATLAGLGVGWIVVTGAPEVDTALAQRAGLVLTAVESGRTTWRVDTAAIAGAPTPARARVVDVAGEELLVLDPDDLADGTAELPAGPPGRSLVLAENARDGWRARLDGTDLSPTEADGWAQAFLLPAGGGSLKVTAPAARPTARVVGWVALGALALLLLWPGRREQAFADRGRRPVPAPARPRVLVLQRVGRAAAGVVALAVAAGLLAVATGVGVGAGRARLDEQVAGLLSTGPLSGAVEAATSAADRVAPAAPDPATTAPEVSLAGAGEVQTCPGSAPDADVSPFATGDPAAGGDTVLQGLTYEVVREGDDRGLRVAACASTAPTSWVVTGGTAVGERPRLLLANPGETAATVDVSVGGPSGPVRTPSSTGLLVAPGEQVEVDLDALAPDLPALLARVDARSGSVAVTGRDSGLVGLVPQGGDAQPAQTEPATSLVLPMVQVPGERGAARLLVAVPGEQAAVVRVRAVPALVAPEDEATDETLEQPAPVDLAGSGTVVAPAGGVADVDLADLPPGLYTLRVDADVPLLASASWQQQRDGEPAEGLTGVPVDRSWVQAVPAQRPWTGPVALDLTAVRAEPEGLDAIALSVLAADGAATTGRVALVDDDGTELAAREYDLPAGSSGLLEVSLSRLAATAADPGAVARVVVTADEPVHLALRALLADPDGRLLGATTLPPPPQPSPVVRLVRG